jgi:sec-independent protein translocase protein TatA
MPNIGPMELIIVLVIVLLIFGPKRLPGLGRQLGSGMKEFKDSVTGKGGDDDERPALTKGAEADAFGRPATPATVVRTDAPGVRTAAPVASEPASVRADAPAQDPPAPRAGA